MRRLAHTIPGSSSIDACTHVQVSRSNGSVVMMAAKISAGVAPDVHLKDQLHADSKACK